MFLIVNVISKIFSVTKNSLVIFEITFAMYDGFKMIYACHDVEKLF